eukprot:5676320-Amphidinium_carterae.1
MISSQGHYTDVPQPPGDPKGGKDKDGKGAGKDKKGKDKKGKDKRGNPSNYRNRDDDPSDTRPICPDFLTDSAIQPKWANVLDSVLSPIHELM